MKFARVLLGVSLMLVLASTARAQIADHMKCYRVKAGAKTRGLVDLVPLDNQLLTEADCKVQGPKLYCVPVHKQNVRVEPSAPGAPDGPEEIPHLCYKLKCKKPFPGPTTVTDQFGTFDLVFKGTSMLCTPVAQPTTSTTTTSTTTTTTGTTLAPNGTPCSSGAQCLSGACVDGFCCNSPCVATCQACSAAKTGGLNGSCASIPAGTDPDGECATQPAPSCGTTGVCNGAGACARYPASTVCYPATCLGDTLANPEFCNGTGTCVASGSTSCVPYACAAGACKTACASDTDCAANNFCSAGMCGPKPNGASCTSGVQCQSGSCVDGVCCNTACAGLCQACSLAKNGIADGTCADIPSGTDPDDECAGTQTCNGAGGCMP